MRRPVLFLPFILCTMFLCAAGDGGDNASKVRRLSEGQAPGKATIADVAWLAGDWIAEGLGGEIHEVFSVPADGQIMAMFRLVTEEGVVFYEFETISESDGSLVYKVKHFNKDLTGWEEKDKYATFRLVEVTPEAACFDGMTLERDGPDAFNGYLNLKQKDGTVRTETIRYRRR